MRVLRMTICHEFQIHVVLFISVQEDDVVGPGREILPLEAYDPFAGIGWVYRSQFLFFILFYFIQLEVKHTKETTVFRIRKESSVRKPVYRL